MNGKCIIVFEQVQVQVFYLNWKRIGSLLLELKRVCFKRIFFLSAISIFEIREQQLENFDCSMSNMKDWSWNMESILPAIFVLLATIPSLFEGNKRRSSKKILIATSLVIYLILSRFCTKEVPACRVFLLDTLVLVIGYTWKTISLLFLKEIPPLLRGDVGPFGKDANKLSTLLAVQILKPECLSMITSYDKDQSNISTKTLTVVAFIICIATALVLEVWSCTMKSTGGHEGISNLAKGTNQSLSFKENLTIALLALGNALCEESEFRGFFMSELESAGFNVSVSNIMQSVSFGIAHWHGVPSGATGVLLTFIYGLIMGLMRYYGNGMLIPVICHAIADYFIFAVIARKQFEHQD